MPDSGVGSMENLIKEENIEAQPYPGRRSEGSIVAKLIERVRLAEKERDSAQSQLLEMIGKYTEAEQRNARLEDEARTSKEEAARSLANLGREETEKVIEWVNKYKTELARNHASEKRANQASEEVEKLRKELEETKSQLEKERNSQTNNEKNSKAILKSNMELASQVADLKRVKMSLEQGMRAVKTDLQNFDQYLAEARTKAAEAEERANQFDSAVAEQRRKSEEEANLLKEAIKAIDKQRMDAQSEVAAMRAKQSKLQKEHEEMRKINGFLATTEAGIVHAELSLARKRIEYLEKKRMGPSDPRVESSLAKKRKSQ